MKVRNCHLVFSLVVVLLPACGGEPSSNAGTTPPATVTADTAEPLLAATPLPPSATPEPATNTPLRPTTVDISPTMTQIVTKTSPVTASKTLSTTHHAPPPTVAPATVPPPTVSPTATVITVPALEGVSPLPPGPTPTEAELRFARGFEYYRNEQWQEAIAEFQQVTKLDANLGLAFGLLGYSYANGPGDFEAAIAALETYLRLVPDADDRSQVEADIITMRSILATQKPLPNLQVPPGKALFVFVNYTVRDWNVDVGPYFMQVSARPAGEEYAVEVIALEPGTYTWQAHSPGGAYTITDSKGNRSFEISLVEGEIVTHEAR